MLYTPTLVLWLVSYSNSESCRWAGLFQKIKNVGEQARNVQASKNHSVEEAQVKHRSIRLREPVLNCSDVNESQSWTNDATIAPAASHCPHVAEQTGSGLDSSNHIALSVLLPFYHAISSVVTTSSHSHFLLLPIHFSTTYLCVTCTFPITQSSKRSTGNNV